MRVLFDAFWWDDGPIANRTVQRELILAWAAQFPDDELTIAVRKDARADGVPVGATVVRTSLWPHGLANRFQLPRRARASSVDVSVVHNFAPRRGTSAVFIHDAMFVDHPEWFSRGERVYFSAMLPWARRAAVVATSTRTEAARLARLGPRLPAPIATGIGVPRALSGARPRRPALPEGIDGFAVTVGRLNVRKNLERILAAAAHAQRIDARHPLVVVGGTAHSGVSTELSPDIRRSIDEGRIVMLGGVDDDELAWLYANAALAITLSLDEGFGMPAVEAAHFGAPLLVSDIDVFRETVGDYARFVDPVAPIEGIAHAIDDAWGTTPDAAARRRIVATYTWENAVRAVRAAIATAL